MRTWVTSPFIAIAAIVSALAQDVVWERDFDAALARARDEKRVCMVAAHLVDEIGSERMIERVYTDARIGELLARTVNIAASNAYQLGRADFLEHFGSPSMDEARALDVAVRTRVLKPDAEGFVIAPQHVFMGPDGAVLLSVPYEITAAELDWCLVEALRRVDATTAPKHSSRARAPRRLIEGGVYDAAGAPPPPKPLEGKELDAAIDEMLDAKAEMGVRATAARAVVLSPQKRALKATAKLLDELDERPGGEEFGTAALLRAIGETSPPEYHELVAQRLESERAKVRAEAAVALEQLGAEGAEALVTRALGREKEPSVRKELARALGASGYDSAKARRELMALAAKDDDGLVRVNAVLAIGRLTPHDELRNFLCEVATEGNDRTRAAALVACVWSRDAYWRDVLPAVLAGEALAAERAAPLTPADAAALGEALRVLEPRSSAALAAVRAVLEKGSLDPLAPIVRDVGGDTLPRLRLFDTPATGE
jgi:HEAT repeat protein